MTADGAKLDAIRTHFAPLIGMKLVCYQTAELLHEDNTWSSWQDLPIRLYTDQMSLVSISWSRFDDLWLANDESLPFCAEDATTRWVENNIDSINGCLGRSIRGVLLSRGQMTIEDGEIEI